CGSHAPRERICIEVGGIQAEKRIKVSACLRVDGFFFLGRSLCNSGAVTQQNAKPRKKLRDVRDDTSPRQLLHSLPTHGCAICFVRLHHAHHHMFIFAAKSSSSIICMSRSPAPSTLVVVP